MMKYAPVLLGTTAALLAQQALGAIVFTDPSFENGGSTTMVDGVNYDTETGGTISTDFLTNRWYMRVLNSTQGGVLEDAAVTGKTGDQFVSTGVGGNWRGLFQYVNDGKATKGTITASIDYWIQASTPDIFFEVFAFDDASTVSVNLSTNNFSTDLVSGSGFISAGGSFLDDVSTTSATTGFTQGTFEFDLDLGTNGYNYIGVVFGNKDSGTASWDNLQVVVPEPGSLALLGLGGLCMMKRRRRA